MAETPKAQQMLDQEMIARIDVAYNKVFPYESTPQNGRNHSHP
jgi:hypothetical protein